LKAKKIKTKKVLKENKPEIVKNELVHFFIDEEDIVSVPVKRKGKAFLKKMKTEDSKFDETLYLEEIWIQQLKIL
jgi:hypothetical protein